MPVFQRPSLFKRRPAPNPEGSGDKPSQVVILDAAMITVNALDPVVIMSANITLEKPARVMIEGVVNGTFYHVCGLAAYVNDTPINLGTGTNNCHADCFQIMYGNGNNSWMCPIPYKTVTDILPAGVHTVGIGVIGKWSGAKRPVYINSRSNNDMASSSSLILQAL